MKFHFAVNLLMKSANTSIEKGIRQIIASNCLPIMKLKSLGSFLINSYLSHSKLDNAFTPP